MKHNILMALCGTAVITTCLSSIPIYAQPVQPMLEYSYFPELDKVANPDLLQAGIPYRLEINFPDSEKLAVTDIMQDFLDFNGDPIVYTYDYTNMSFGVAYEYFIDDTVIDDATAQASIEGYFDELVTILTSVPYEDWAEDGVFVGLYQDWVNFVEDNPHDGLLFNFEMCMLGSLPSAAQWADFPLTYCIDTMIEGHILANPELAPFYFY